MFNWLYNVITYEVCYRLTTEIYKVDQSHGRFCFVLQSKRLINPIYFCSKSVTNLIRTDICFKLITKSYLSHHKTVFIKANFLFLFNEKFARGIFIG